MSLVVSALPRITRLLWRASSSVDRRLETSLSEGLFIPCWIISASFTAFKKLWNKINCLLTVNQAPLLFLALWNWTVSRQQWLCIAGRWNWAWEIKRRKNHRQWIKVRKLFPERPIQDQMRSRYIKSLFRVGVSWVISSVLAIILRKPLSNCSVKTQTGTCLSTST